MSHKVRMHHLFSKSAKCKAHTTIDPNDRVALPIFKATFPVECPESDWLKACTSIQVIQITFWDVGERDFTFHGNSNIEAFGTVNDCHFSGVIFQFRIDMKLYGTYAMYGSTAEKTFCFPSPETPFQFKASTGRFDKEQYLPGQTPGRSWLSFFRPSPRMPPHLDTLILESKSQIWQMSWQAQLWQSCLNSLKIIPSTHNALSLCLYSELQYQCSCTRNSSLRMLEHILVRQVGEVWSKERPWLLATTSEHWDATSPRQGKMPSKNK